MGLRLKFNIVLIVVFLTGFAAAGYISRQLLLANAREEVLREARLMMDAAGAVRNYTVDQIRPLLEQKSGEKVVFVDFCDGTPWQDVVTTMDRVRSLAEDKDHNNIKVALKKREKKSDLAADPTRIDPCS